MMNTKRIILLTFAAGAFACQAQQALWGDRPVVSPIVHNDMSVTFRLKAPNAREVTVTGDFLPLKKVNTPFGEVEAPGEAALVKGPDGVWEYTTSSLSPELYSYSFMVDSLKMNDPANVYQIRDVASVTNVFLIPGENASLYAVKDVPHGSVSKVWYDSPSLGMKRRMSIYTPPGYETSGESYPVFYLLHGMGGDEEAWLSLGRTAQILDNLIAEGKAKPMIVVMPNGNAAQEAAPGESKEGFVQPTMALPKTMEGSFESAFPDIVAFVNGNYRTKADKAHRAIAGLSMGGFHSMHISKEYPDMFDYVGLFSAATLPRTESDSPIYADFDGKLRRQFEKNPKLYWIAIGDKDFLYQANVDFRHKLDAAGFPYTYHESPDGHIWKNWRSYLSLFAPLLFQP